MSYLVVLVESRQVVMNHPPLMVQSGVVAVMNHPHLLVHSAVVVMAVSNHRMVVLVLLTKEVDLLVVAAVMNHTHLNRHMVKETVF